MTAYERPSFSVAQSGRSPDSCGHGWIRPNGECQFCGIDVLRSLIGSIDCELPGPIHYWPDGQIRSEPPYRCGTFRLSDYALCTKWSDHEGDCEFPTPPEA